MGAKKGKTLNPCLEHEKAIDKFVVAVEKEGQIVGHLSKSEPVVLQKQDPISYVRTMEMHVKLKFDRKEST